MQFITNIDTIVVILIEYNNLNYYDIVMIKLSI